MKSSLGAFCLTLLASALGSALAQSVTLEHRYGSTTVPEPPKRVVTVGFTEQDALLALGVVPVGTTEWFGGYPGALWPWARAKLGDAPLPEVVGDSSSINFEKILALEPDLILALDSGVTADDYKLLSEIAPTLTRPPAYPEYGVPWQVLTRAIGKAVGKVAEADALVAEVEAQLAQVRQDHPEFLGATSVMAAPYEGVYVFGRQEVRGKLLNELGFRLPDGLEALIGKGVGGNLSMERLDLLDVDVIVWMDIGEGAVLQNPLYKSLSVHTEGREVFLDSFNDPVGAATSFVTVLSLPYLLDGLVPRLAAAMDGDPQTVAASSAE